MNKLPDSKIHKFDEILRLEEEAKNAKNTKKKPAGGKNTNKNSKLASRKMSQTEACEQKQNEGSTRARHRGFPLEKLKRVSVACTEKS